MTDQTTKPDLLATSGKIYGVCVDCGEITRVNKPILGSLHICTTPEERISYRAEIASKARVNRHRLAAAKSDWLWE